METRTITVQGTGEIRVKPDRIDLSMTLETLERDYEKAAQKASDQIEALGAALAACGFLREDLKTANFNVYAKYEGVHRQNGEYREEFAGYNCTHKLRLSFDFDPQRLCAVLGAIAESKTNPQLSIGFSAKNPAKISAALLRSAAKNAKEKAKTLAKASGAALGELVSIEYGFRNRAFDSNTRIEMQRDYGGAPMMAKAAFGSSFAPEDLELTDQATFVWELIPVK